MIGHTWYHSSKKCFEVIVDLNTYRQDISFLSSIFIHTAKFRAISALIGEADCKIYDEDNVLRERSPRLLASFHINAGDTISSIYEQPLQTREAPAGA